MVICFLWSAKKRCLSLLSLNSIGNFQTLLLQDVRAAQCYQKSVAAVTGHRGWEKVAESCKEALACSKDWLALLEKVKGAEALQLLNSARLSVANVVKAVEKAQARVDTGLLSDEMEAAVLPVREALKVLMERISQLKS